MDLVHNNALSGFSTDKANQMSVSHFRYKKKSYQKHIDKNRSDRNAGFFVISQMKRLGILNASKTN